MNWWEAAVRIRIGNEWGSGVLVAPQVVLTAAHVVSPGPGAPAAAPAAITVTAMFGPISLLAVHRVEVASEWAAAAVGADLHDFAVLAVDAGGVTQLLPAYSFGTIGKPFEAAAYGFVGDQAVRGRFLRGTVVSDGAAYASSDLAPEPGMSGGPLLAVSSSEPGGPVAYTLVGISRSRPHVAGTTANVGLPIQSPPFNALMLSLTAR